LITAECTRFERVSQLTWKERTISSEFKRIGEQGLLLQHDSFPPKFLPRLFLPFSLSLSLSLLLQSNTRTLSGNTPCPHRHYHQKNVINPFFFFLLLPFHLSDLFPQYLTPVNSTDKLLVRIIKRLLRRVQIPNRDPTGVL